MKKYKDYSAELSVALQEQFAVLQTQMERLKRQVFGQRSKRRNFDEAPQQLNIAELFNVLEPLAEVAPKKPSPASAAKR